MFGRACVFVRVLFSYTFVPLGRGTPFSITEGVCVRVRVGACMRVCARARVFVNTCGGARMRACVCRLAVPPFIEGRVH